VTIAVYGDAPYSTVQTDYSVSPPTNSDHTQIDGTPGFVDAVNADKKVKLVMFAGDIHSGKEPCTFAYDRSIYDF
jgi:hypothetical protein